MNKVLTTLNQPLDIQLYGIPVPYNQIDGLPLGTTANTSDSELGVKVILIGNSIVNQKPVTPSFHSLGASTSFSIPIGARGWTVTFLTGTGTIGGKAVPAGFSESDPNTLAAAIAIATDSGSSAYVRYNT